MKLNSAQSNFYDQEKDYSFRAKDSSAKKGQIIRSEGKKAADEDISLPDFMKRRRSKTSRIRTNQDGDIADFMATKPKTEAEIKKERLQKRRQAELKRKQAARERLMKTIATLMATATIAGGIKAGGDYITRFDPASANYDAMNHTIEEVSDWTGVDEKAILIANQMGDKTEQVGEIVLPESYSPLEQDISGLQEKLEKGRLTSEERDELQKELDFLKEKQKEQEALGTTYIDEDGKFVYIVPNEVTSTETIKDAYGIEDGVLREYNDLSYTWGWNPDVPEHNSYKDYTGSQTSGVRVPADEINNFEEE